MKITFPLLLLFLPFCAFSQQYTWTTLPNHTWPDSLHAPFILGVASNEPGQNEVYLWTYAEPTSFTQPSVSVNWEVATDSLFTNIIQSGTSNADSSRSWTLTEKISNLSPDTYYWYRFNDGSGNQSVTGRTRTLPDNSNEIRLVVSSCSNIIAYYNSYARIAEQPDINAVIHLGDWAYDNLNAGRSVRLPDPNVTIRCGVEERRKRDYLHLLDPDLRAVRQMHPFISMWDNHDIQRGDPEWVKDGCRRVFRDFNGQPVFDPADTSRQYRKISMGPLVDLFLIDIQWTQDQRDSLNGYESYLGAVQHNWLLNELQNSSAKWKLVGNQKLLSHFSIAGLDPYIPGGAGADEKSWDGYAEEREDILEFIRDNDIDNVMILSGDAHFVVIADVPIDPLDGQNYNGNTGEGSVCVEYLPSGISSPNINERGVPTGLQGLLRGIAYAANPHQRWLEFMDNGYGIIHIRPDSIEAETWLLDCQSVNNNQDLKKRHVLLDRANHWKRAGDTLMSGRAEVRDIEEIGIVSMYPNPAAEELTVDFLSLIAEEAWIEILDLQGRVLQSEKINTKIGANQWVVKLAKLSSGSYMLRLKTHRDQVVKPFLKE